MADQNTPKKDPEIESALEEMHSLERRTEAHNEAFKQLVNHGKGSLETIMGLKGDMELSKALLFLETLMKDTVDGHQLSSEKAINASLIAHTLEGMLKEIADNPEAYKATDIDLLVKKACIDIYKAVDLEAKQVKESTKIIKMSNDERNALVNDFKSNVGSFVLDMNGRQNVETILQSLTSVKECAENTNKEVNRIYHSLEEEAGRLQLSEDTLRKPITTSIKVAKAITTFGACMALGYTIRQDIGINGTENFAEMQAKTDLFLQDLGQSMKTTAEAGVFIYAGLTATSTLKTVVEKVIGMTESAKGLSEKCVKSAVKASAMMMDFKESVEELCAKCETLIEKSVDERNASSKTLENLEKIKQDIEQKISEAETLKDEKKSPKFFNLVFQREMVKEFKESYKSLKDEISQLKSELDKVKSEISSVNSPNHNNREAEQIVETIRGELPHIGRTINQDQTATREINQEATVLQSEIADYEETQEESRVAAQDTTLEQVIVDHMIEEPETERGEVENDEHNNEPR